MRNSPRSRSTSRAHPRNRSGITAGVVLLLLVAGVAGWFTYEYRGNLFEPQVECPARFHDEYLKNARDLHQRYTTKWDRILKIEKDAARHQVFNLETNQRLISMHNSLAHLAAEMRNLSPPPRLPAVTIPFRDLGRIAGQYAVLALAVLANPDSRQPGMAQELRSKCLS